VRVIKINFLRRSNIPYLLAPLVALYIFALSPPKAFAATNGKITYCLWGDTELNVYVIDANGSNKTQVTTDGTSCMPSFAPNGSKITYWSPSGETYWLSLVNPDGTENQKNFVNGTYQFWLPGSSRLFYIDFSSGFQPKTMNVDASGVENVAWSPGLEGANQMDFSQDLSKLTYANPDGELVGVYIADSDGSNPTTINTVDNAFLPTFSADGNKIFFVGTSGGESYQLYSVNIDGTNETLIRELPISGGPIALLKSPDGSKLLLNTANNDTTDSYTMDVDGSNFVQIIDDKVGGPAYQVGWSPDGTKLVFSKPPDDGDIQDIFTINADGTGLTNITNTADDDERIMYSSQAWGAVPEEAESDSSDQDNISDTVENAAPNEGDANNDGTQDSEQDNVASFVDPVSDEYAALEVSDECSITAVSIDSESSSHADPDFSYPTGLMDFTLDCGTNGFTADITQYYYGQDSTDFVVRKHNPDTGQYSTIDGAELSQQTIDNQTVTKATYQVKDGGSLDLDNTEDGNIHDPAGLASQIDTLADTGQNTQWMIVVALSLLVSGSVGGVNVKRRIKI
jgi:Tol biopolymer transport system component